MENGIKVKIKDSIDYFTGKKGVIVGKVREGSVVQYIIQFKKPTVWGSFSKEEFTIIRNLQ